MPLPMVHLGTAREYARSCPLLLNCPEFYLGSISPDAIHMRQNSTSEDKSISHFHAEGDIWKENVLNFIKQNRTKPNYNFLLGYGIHILTDIIWYETIYAKFKSDYYKDSSPIQDARMAYYNDTDQLDFELYKICKWRKNIWDLLEEATPYDVDDILTANEINAWKIRTLHWFDSGASKHKNPIKYISIKDLTQFIKDAGNRIKGILESEGLK